MTRLAKLARTEPVLLTILAVVLAVIDNDESRRVAGMVSRADIHAAHNRALIACKAYKNDDHG